MRARRHETPSPCARASARRRSGPAPGGAARSRDGLGHHRQLERRPGPRRVSREPRRRRRARARDGARRQRLERRERRGGLRAPPAGPAARDGRQPGLRGGREPWRTGGAGRRAGVPESRCARAARRARQPGRGARAHAGHGHRRRRSLRGGRRMAAGGGALRAARASPPRHHARPARGAAPPRAPPRRLGVRHLHGGAPRPLPPARGLRPALLPLRRGPRPLLPRGAPRGLHHPRARGARRPRPEPVRRAALRRRARGRGGEGRDALLRRARRAGGALALPRRGGVQVRLEDGARRRPRAARGGRDLRPRGARLPHLRSGRLVSELVTLAVPCRSDEPALGRTLAAALASWRQAPASATHGLEVLVCLNGADGPRPRADLLAFARDASAPLVEIDLERGEGAASAPPASAALTVAALVTRRAGKPIAWNALRRRARASAKTTCAPRPGLFEGIMAAPYGVDFPNLSPQLYAARVAALPPAMPEDLIEPERWLELMLGCKRIIRVPAARVAVRLPGTLPDFFRQRIRIEMGKVQLARQYPELAARGAPQPRARAALASLGPGGLARLAAYLGLRSAAHAVAWWRYRRGATAGIWRQAATTKRWDAA